MRTLNVRLRDEDEVIVEALRRQGVEISSVVRDALRAKYLEMALTRTKEDVRALIAVLEEMPGDQRPLVNARDKEAVREHIRARLRR